MARDEDRKDYTIQLADGTTMYEKAVERALGRLADHGLDLHSDRPRWSNGGYFDGRLPSNLNSLPATDLGELFLLMCTYADYVSSLRVTLEAEKRNYAEQLELTKARVSKSKDGSADERRQETLCDVRYVEANARWLEATTIAELVNNIEEAARRDLKTISRIIEVRKIDLELGGRAESLNRGGGRGGGGGRPGVFDRNKRP